MSQAGSFGEGLTPPPGSVISLTGNSGGPVGPDGSGNINVVGILDIDVSGDAGTNTETISTLFIPNKLIRISDDFIGATSGLSGQLLSSQLDWYSPGFSMQTNLSTILSSAHPGLLSNFDTNAGNNWSLFLSSGQDLEPAILLGGGAITLNWVMDIATLSAASPRYIFRFGFGDTNNADQANGVYFEYSDNINSGNWVIKTAAASSRTTTNTATVVTTGYKNFQISINAAGTSAEFFIGGVSQGTIATNLPALAITPFFDMMATVGTVADSSLRADIMYMQQILTVAR
jgi:hypothetical protein